MMMEHTKEPWFCEGDAVYNNAKCSGDPIAHILTSAYDGNFNNIDARHIVACVNKFAGMTTKEIEALPANVPMLLKRLSERSLQVDQLQEVCAEAYQFAGAYDAPVEVLDNLHAAANGLPLPHESFLPVDDSELVKQRDRLLEALVASEHFMVVATDWNMDVVEINGEMRSTYDLLGIVRAAIAAVKGE